MRVLSRWADPLGLPDSPYQRTQTFGIELTCKRRRSGLLDAFTPYSNHRGLPSPPLPDSTYSTPNSTSARH